MKPTAKPKAGKQSRQVCPAALRYEAEKAGFRTQGLSPADYARACLRAARRAGL